MSEWGVANGVNHLVYVSLLADVDVPLVDDLAADLERIAVSMDELRFLDTVGYRLAVLGQEGYGAGGDSDRHLASVRRGLRLIARAMTLEPGLVRNRATQ